MRHFWDALHAKAKAEAGYGQRMQFGQLKRIEYR
jgi:hypothetical protein